MDKSKVDYVLHYFSELMNKNETAAWRHWVCYQKAIHPNSSKEENEIRIKSFTKDGLLSSDENVLELLTNGSEKFRENTAERIFSNHPEVLDYNNCSKCGKLARTPFAKQCRYCGYDWH